MRLWSIHPRYLDRVGLVACWREALLAKAVLSGKTRGYKHHPQLTRFRAVAEPVKAINSYLAGLWNEAHSRGYRFDKRKIGPIGRARLTVTRGQLEYEYRHLCTKLARRCPPAPCARRVAAHPLFRVVRGGIAGWERI